MAHLGKNMNIKEVIDYHEKQAVHFEPFGTTNALTVFHRSVVEAIKAVVVEEREACAVVAENFSTRDGYEIAHNIRTRAVW